MLSAECSRLLAAAPPRPSRRTLSLPENRAGLEAQTPLFGAADPTVDTEDTTLGGVPVRVYRPGDEGAGGVCVYVHGGGWALGSLETHHALCSRIAARARCAVVSVAYRQPPEHPFPAALDDVVTVLRVLREPPPAGLGPGRIAVAGDSAGGNLAAAAALLVRGEVDLAHVLLLLPATDNRPDRYASYREFARGYPLTADDMSWYFEQYVGGRWADLDDFRFAPMRGGDLRGLPPTTIVTAECDPLRDEGEAFGSRLVGAGVPVTTRRYLGTFHPFFLYFDRLEAAQDCQAFSADAIAAALRSLGPAHNETNGTFGL
jgi:acetyl esterase